MRNTSLLSDASRLLTQTSSIMQKIPPNRWLRFRRVFPVTVRLWPHRRPRIVTKDLSSRDKAFVLRRRPLTRSRSTTKELSSKRKSFADAEATANAVAEHGEGNDSFTSGMTLKFQQNSLAWNKEWLGGSMLNRSRWGLETSTCSRRPVRHQDVNCRRNRAAFIDAKVLSS